MCILNGKIGGITASFWHGPNSAFKSEYQNMSKHKIIIFEVLKRYIQ